MNQDPILDSTNIQIDVLNNVIYLRGIVDSRRDKKRAEVLVEDIYGIEDVQNQLKIAR
jgi:osmotically-inducible protein OsmY